MFRRGRHAHVVTWLGALALFLAGGASARAQYTVIDLGPIYISPFGHRIGAFGINNLGDVVGGAPIGGSCHAVLWPASAPRVDLGSLGGDSYALGLNDLGQVVGRFGDMFGSGNSNAFIWDAANGMRELFPLPGNSFGTAGSINSAGQVVGESSNYSGDPNTHAVMWPTGAGNIWVDFGNLPGASYSSAAFPNNGINSYGQVVGLSGQPDVPHAFLWTPYTPNSTSGSMIDLGTLGGAQSAATGINATGHVVGYFYGAGNTPQHPFVWTPTSPNAMFGSMVDIGTLGGTDANAFGINDAGLVVGASMISGSSTFHAYIYSGGLMQDLNSLIPAGSGWELLQAFSINNRGQIVGYGLLNGAFHSFVVSPPSAVNNPPVLTVPANVIGVVLQPMTFTATASDPDGDAVSFSLIGAPPGAAINSVSGVFNWTPSTAGTFTFQVRATDSHGLTDTKSVTATVQARFMAAIDMTNVTLSRNENVVTASYDLIDKASVAVTNVVVTSATLKNTPANLPLPGPRTIPANGGVHESVQFTGVPSGGPVYLVINIAFDGGTLTFKKSVTVP